MEVQVLSSAPIKSISYKEKAASDGGYLFGMVALRVAEGSATGALGRTEERRRAPSWHLQVIDPTWDQSGAPVKTITGTTTPF